MSDLISRQKAIDIVISESTDDGAYGYVDTKSVVRLINSLPSAQPDIIRCKDCEWCVEHYDTDGNAPYWICKNWDSGTDADGFCYEAERRTDE